MYLIFRCDCGRVLYAKKGVATRKCTCGNKEAVPDIGKIMSKDRELEDSLKMFSGS